MLRRMATLVYVGYGAFFACFGALGLLLAHLEFPMLFQVPVETLQQTAAGTTLLNQYRFLRGMELGFGLVLLTLRHTVVTDAQVRQAVLLALLALPVARTVSFVVDGWPWWPFACLVLVEYGIVALLAAAWRDKSALQHGA